jgi:hypothetical protein
MIIETQITSEISETWTRAFSESLIQTPFISEAWHRLYFSTAGKAENLFIMHIPELDIIAPFSKNESVLSFIGKLQITRYWY